MERLIYEFSRPSRAPAPSSAPPLTSYPIAVRHAASAWRTLAGKFLSGLSFHREATTKVRGSTSPHVGSVAASAPGLGLPHHRHPMSVDEATAGIVLAFVLTLSLGYLLWSFA